MTSHSLTAQSSVSSLPTSEAPNGSFSLRRTSLVTPIKLRISRSPIPGAYNSPILKNSSSSLETPLSQEVAPPSQEIASPSQEVAPPSQEIASPSQEVAPPSQEVAPLSQEVALPLQGAKRLAHTLQVHPPHDHCTW
ncbi:hypothetical protein BDR06DRAFT_1003980 [Suillus hirtellus]|nr:hypothetical protein BDR06DRAFT_1003980 [Suillus hirtellus]